MEKNIKKRMSIYVQLSHFAVQQKLTQHCKSTTLQFKKNQTTIPGFARWGPGLGRWRGGRMNMV